MVVILDMQTNLTHYREVVGWGRRCSFVPPVVQVEQQPKLLGWGNRVAYACNSLSSSCEVSTVVFFFNYGCERQHPVVIWHCYNLWQDEKLDFNGTAMLYALVVIYWHRRDFTWRSIGNDQIGQLKECWLDTLHDDMKITWLHSDEACNQEKWWLWSRLVNPAILSLHHMGRRLKKKRISWTWLGFCWCSPEYFLWLIKLNYLGVILRVSPIVDVGSY